MARPKLGHGTTIHITKRDALDLNGADDWAVDKAFDVEFDAKRGEFLGCKRLGGPLDLLGFSARHEYAVDDMLAGTSHVNRRPSTRCNIVCMFEQLDAEFDLG